MKYLIAIIQPHKLDGVREALSELGAQGLTVSEVRGFGRQKGHTEIYRGSEYQIDFVPKIKLEIALPSEMVDKAIKTICDSARTEKVGDGKIFTMNLEDVLRIRTGETGSDAI